jgi:hypothetical protein
MKTHQHYSMEVRNHISLCEENAQSRQHFYNKCEEGLLELVFCVVDWPRSLELAARGRLGPSLQHHHTDEGTCLHHI